MDNSFENGKIEFDDLIKTSTLATEYISLSRRLKFKSEALNKTLRIGITQGNSINQHTLQLDGQVQPALDAFNRDGVILVNGIDASVADCLAALIIETAKRKNLVASKLKNQILDIEIANLASKINEQRDKSDDAIRKIEDAVKTIEETRKKISESATQFSSKQENTLQSIKSGIDSTVVKISAQLEELKRFGENATSSLDAALKEASKANSEKLEAYKVIEEKRLEELTKTLSTQLDKKISTLEGIQAKWKESAEKKLGRVLGELSSDRLTASFKRAHKFKRIGAWVYLMLVFATFICEAFVIRDAYEMHKQAKEVYLTILNAPLTVEEKASGSTLKSKNDEARNNLINEEVDIVATRVSLLLPLLGLSIFFSRKEKSIALLAERYRRIASILETLGSYTEEIENPAEKEKIRQSVSLEIFSLNDLKDEKDGDKIISKAIKLISAVRSSQ